MKKWPEKQTETVNFVELMIPLKKIMKDNYTQKSNVVKTIPYDGYDFGPIGRACLPGPKELLKASNLKYDQEEQGRELMDTLLMVVFNLGMENGRRASNEQTRQILSAVQNIKDCMESPAGAEATAKKMINRHLKFIEEYSEMIEIEKARK